MRQLCPRPDTRPAPSFALPRPAPPRIHPTFEMNIHPAKDAFVTLATRGNVIPVYTDLMADFETPVSAYAKLQDAGPSYLFESIEGGENLARYSFIGCRPRKIFVCGATTTNIRAPGKPAQTVPTPRDPLTLIAGEMQGYKPVAM